MKASDIQFDSRDNIFVDLENIRISYVESSNRSSDKDWPGADVLRIQAYRGEGSALHKGAELPIHDKDNIVDLIEVLIKIYKELGKENQPPTANF